jgi:hypothetical protein
MLQHPRATSVFADPSPQPLNISDPSTTVRTTEMREQPRAGDPQVPLHFPHSGQLVSDIRLELGREEHQPGIPVLGPTGLDTQRPGLQVQTWALVSVSTSLRTRQPYA